MTTENDRMLINFIRGIAVFLMLWGHCIQCCCNGQFDFFEDTAFKTIYAFHMPLFMLVSGYLFFFSARKRGMTELIEYKTRSLLYPILMCSLVNLFVTKSVSVLRGKFTGILGGVSLTDLWFLWSVLACGIALGLAVKITKNKILQALLILLGFGCVAVFPCWNMNVYMYPYFIVGYLYAAHRERLGGALRWAGPVSLAAFIAMLPFFRTEHYIYGSGILGGGSLTDSLKIDLFRWGIGLFGSIAAVRICKLLHSAFCQRPMVRVRGIALTDKLKMFAEKMGEHSLAIYTLSVSFLSFILPKIANRFLLYVPIDLGRYIWIFDLIATPLLATAYAVFLLLLIKLLKKVGAYRLIFGR